MSREGAGTIVTDVPQNSEGAGTIVADVPTDEERVLQSPRMAAMAQIQVDRQDVDAEGFSDVPATVQEAVKDDAGAGVQAGGVKIAAPDAMVEVIEHGIARLVPVSEAVKGYQMESVARENLRKASEALKEAVRIKSQVVVPVAAPAVSVESVKGALDLMVEGETGSAAEKLVGLFTAPVAAQPLDVQGEVRKALAAEEGGKVFEKFLGDYKELADPDIYAVCDKIFEREFQPLLETGELSYEEALRKAGDLTRVKFNIKVEEAAPVVVDPPVVTGRAAVAANKAKITNIPTAGGRTPTVSVDKPKSTTEVIAEMRQRRGLS